MDDDIDIDLREVDLITSSNTSGEVATFDFSDIDDVSSIAVNVPYEDADGVYYDDSGDVLFQINRSGNTVVAYEDFKKLDNGVTAAPTFSSPANVFSNGRGLAFSRGRVIIAQDGNDSNGNQNKLIVMDYDDDNGFTLRNVFTVDFNLWGIFADGDDVYAIVDNSSDVAYFNEFYDNETDGAIVPSRMVTIEGLTRTHGIHFSDSENETVILTDIGDAAEGDDGALILIKDFDDKVLNAEANGGVISTADQIRFAGSNTQLGNPVDVEYDSVSERIYVAERKTAGGMLLVFDYDENENGGNIAPLYKTSVAGISSVALDTGL